MECDEAAFEELKAALDGAPFNKPAVIETACQNFVFSTEQAAAMLDQFHMDDDKLGVLDLQTARELWAAIVVSDESLVLSFDQLTVGFDELVDSCDPAVADMEQGTVDYESFIVQLFRRGAFRSLRIKEMGKVN